MPAHVVVDDGPAQGPVLVGGRGLKGSHVRGHLGYLAASELLATPRLGGLAVRALVAAAPVSFGAYEAHVRMITQDGLHRAGTEPQRLLVPRIHAHPRCHRDRAGPTRGGAVDLDETEPAIAQGVKTRVGAQPGHVDPGAIAGVEDAGSGRDLDLLVVDDHEDHGGIG